SHISSANERIYSGSRCGACRRRMQGGQIWFVQRLACVRPTGLIPLDRPDLKLGFAIVVGIVEMMEQKIAAITGEDGAMPRPADAAVALQEHGSAAIEHRLSSIIE